MSASRFTVPTLVAFLLAGLWYMRTSLREESSVIPGVSVPTRPTTININGTAVNDKTLDLEIAGKGTAVSYSTFDNIKGSKGTVVLLHGERFSKQTWKELGTMHRLAEQGYLPVAVDLPGKGDSTSIDGAERESWLKKFLAGADITSPIVISPSASGWYAVPEIVKNPSSYKGWIPVAPMGTDDVSESDWKSVTTPVLFIQGEKDSAAYSSAKVIVDNVSGSKAFVMPGATHPCYLDGPELFHHVVLSFLDSLTA